MEAAFNTNPTYIDKAPRIGCFIPTSAGQVAGVIEQGDGRLNLLHTRGTTEERFVKNWLLTEPRLYWPSAAGALYNDLLRYRWGLTYQPDNGCITYQGVNYRTTTNALDYGKCWVIRGALLSSTEADGTIIDDKNFKATVFFSVSPNAGLQGTASSARLRTSCQRAQGNYTFFKECIKASIDATLNAMISEGVDIAFMERISHGRYAGSFEKTLPSDYPAIIEESLSEVITNDGKTRGHFFQQVILVDQPTSI